MVTRSPVLFSSAFAPVVDEAGSRGRALKLRIAHDPAADELLGPDLLALLIGMLLDQQFPS